MPRIPRLKERCIEERNFFCTHAAVELYGEAVLAVRASGALTDADIDDVIPVVVCEVLAIGGVLPGGVPAGLSATAREQLIVNGLGPQFRRGPADAIIRMLRRHADQWRYLITAGQEEVPAAEPAKVPADAPAQAEPARAPSSRHSTPAAVSVSREEAPAAIESLHGNEPPHALPSGTPGARPNDITPEDQLPAKPAAARRPHLGRKPNPAKEIWKRILRSYGDADWSKHAEEILRRGHEEGIGLDGLPSKAWKQRNCRNLDDLANEIDDPAVRELVVKKLGRIRSGMTRN